MSLSEWITAGVALAALVLGVVNFLVERNRAKDATVRARERDSFEQRTTEEAVEIQRRLFEIEERRHQWEQERRTTEAAASLRAEEAARTAAMKVRFAYRDSARTWARIFATNYGPADASDVALDVYARKDGKAVEVEPVGGTDYRTADRVRPNESVHVGVAFTMGSPQAEDLRYGLSWIDGRGQQTEEGQVPIE